MNAQDADSLPPDTQGEPAAAGEGTAPAPKRRRAPRKTATADAAAGGAADAAGQDAPASRASTADEAAAEPPAAKPARARRTPRTAAAAAREEPAREATDTGVQSSASGTAAAAGDAQTPPDGAATQADAPTAADDGKQRRRRNRRRGRRAGDKRGSEGEVSATDAAGEMPSAPPRGGEPRPGQAASAATRAPEAAAVFAEVLAGAFDLAATADVGDPADAAVAAGASPQDAPAATQPEPSGAAGDDAEAGHSPAAEGADRADGGDAVDKRVLAADRDAPKLHKVLAQSGVGSRRDLEQMILGGRVTVNGEVAHVGQRVSFGDRIAIDGKPVRVRIAPPPPRVLAYHKPAGEVVTHDDPQQRPTVFRRLPRLQQGKWQSVGRLDINTEGLLLFTNSGELANQLMHPRFGVEREYAVRSLGTLTPEAKARLLEGVEIDGQPCAFKSIEDGGGEGVNHWYRCVITEGRNREVRKLFDAVGHAVSRLIRIRYGSVVLPKGLKRGVWVDLGSNDLRDLRRLAGHTLRGDEGADATSGRGRTKGNRKKRDGQPVVQGAGLPAQAAERPPRPERPPRGERPPRPPREDAFEGGAIPNPLQQTFDKRAIQQERMRRRDFPEDGPIPNPLQQTFDKRAIQQERAQRREIPEDGPIPNPLQQTYDKRFASGGGNAFGKPGPRGGTGVRANPGLGGPGGKAGGRGGKNRGAAQGAKKGGGQREPDPMQTSVGYIGGDAFLRKGAGGGGRGSQRGPRGSGAAGGQRGPGGNRGGRKR